jgi:hypothetical protein
MPVIFFFGPDGSGKSTISKSVATILTKYGLKVKISWMRGSHTLASILARCLHRIDGFRGSDNPYYKIRIPPKLRRLWQTIEFVSVLPILLVKFILPNLLGYVVVAERYLPDYIVWISLTTRDMTYENSIVAKFFKALANRAMIRIYMTASLEELYKRRPIIDSLPIEHQLTLYEDLAVELGALKLDTTKKTTSQSLEIAFKVISRKMGLPLKQGSNIGIDSIINS